jgi:CBS-domain-containing membrane protein
MIEPTIKINSTGSTLDSKGSEATAMWKENLYTLAGIAIGMGIICFTSYYFQVLFLIPSLASSAIMLFMSYNNVFAQPRNVMGGHFVSAIAALILGHFFGQEWWAIAMVVVLASILMIITHTIHPPGGGTAIAAYLGNYSIPVLLGNVILDAFIIIVVAVVVNNAIPTRKYPRFWI